jgi:hypothetical protein
MLASSPFLFGSGGQTHSAELMEQVLQVGRTPSQRTFRDLVKINELLD